MTDSASDSATWFHVAKLLRPQGRKGELLADPLTDVPGIFAAGRELTLLVSGGASRQVTLEDSWRPSGKNSGRIVLKLSGCDSISDAEALTGSSLAVPASEQPSLEDDTFFVSDLVGCTLYDGPQRAGTVIDLQFATTPDGRSRLEDAAPLLVIETESGPQPVMVPFVKAWLDRVDLQEQTITMRLPEGLFDIAPDGAEPEGEV